MQLPPLDADSLFEDLVQDLPPETAQMAAVSYLHILPPPLTPHRDRQTLPLVPRRGQEKRGRSASLPSPLFWVILNPRVKKQKTAIVLVKSGSLTQ